MEQRSEEWFKVRQGRVTGSAVGAILNLSPFSNEKDVMRRMVRDWHGAPREFIGNFATDWGVANEAGAISQFEMSFGVTVEKCGFYEYEDWLGASPDGLVGAAGLVEVKCPFGLRNNPKPVFKTAKMQPHYYAQMQVQLYVTNRSVCYFYQWAPNGDDLEIVKFDKGYLDTIQKPLKMFYEQYLIEREMPNAEKYLDGQEIDI
jgi:putative phage-type endonuclease